MKFLLTFVSSCALGMTIEAVNPRITASNSINSAQAGARYNAAISERERLAVGIQELQNQLSAIDLTDAQEKERQLAAEELRSQRNHLNEEERNLAIQERVMTDECKEYVQRLGSILNIINAEDTHLEYRVPMVKAVVKKLENDYKFLSSSAKSTENLLNMMNPIMRLSQFNNNERLKKDKVMLRWLAFIQAKVRSALQQHHFYNDLELSAPAPARNDKTLVEINMELDRILASEIEAGVVVLSSETIAELNQINQDKARFQELIGPMERMGPAGMMEVFFFQKKYESQSKSLFIQEDIWGQGDILLDEDAYESDPAGKWVWSAPDLVIAKERQSAVQERVYALPALRKAYGEAYQYMKALVDVIDDE